MRIYIRSLLLLLTLCALWSAAASRPAVTRTTTITDRYTTRIAETVVRTSFVRSVTTTTVTTILESTSTTHKLVPTPKMVIIVKTIIQPMWPPKTVYIPVTTFIIVPTTVQSEIVKTQTFEIVETLTTSSPKLLTEKRYSTLTLERTITSRYVEYEPTTKTPSGGLDIGALSSPYLTLALIGIILVLIGVIVIRTRGRPHSTPSRRYCVNCGSTLPSYVKYCQKCGTRQD